MKIATWNIGEDERDKDGKLNIDSYNYIIDFIKREDFDVICLQEAVTTSKELPIIADYIIENTELKHKAEYELSDSHINIGSRMGVAIVSKYDIESSEKIAFENPNLIRVISEEVTFKSHDKGVLITKIKDFNIVTGHCLPFHVFKKDINDYTYIFKEAEDKFMEIINRGEKFVLCGDLNTERVDIIFPRVMEACKDLIKCPTRYDKQLDHFIINKELDLIHGTVLKTYFDHNIGIFEVN